MRWVLAVALFVLLAAPARAADPGTVEAGQLGDYPYLVYVPTTYDAARPAPLVVMTHGCQTTAEQQMKANLYNAVAEREGFVVLYPDVNPVEANQPGPLKRCWQFPLPTSWHRDAGDPAAIAGMTRAVMDRWNIDDERVYMVGMSAGSFMTSIQGAAYPDLYAAVTINAGGAYSDGTCIGTPLAGRPVEGLAQDAFAEMGPRARVVPRLVMGGDKDGGIPPECADKALEQGLRTNNLVLSGSQTSPIALTPATTEELPAETPGGYPSTLKTYLDPGGCVVGQRLTIHGMNHYWPGGSSDPESAPFTDPKGPNGAEFSWNFLKRYTKSSTASPCTQAPEPCLAHQLAVKVPRGAKRVRVRVDGKPVAARVKHRRVRLKAGCGAKVVVRGRRAGGKRFTRRRTA